MITEKIIHGSGSQSIDGEFTGSTGWNLSRMKQAVNANSIELPKGIKNADEFVYWIASQQRHGDNNVKCLFDDLPEFNHYGGKIVYWLSCPCPKCTPHC